MKQPAGKFSPQLWVINSSLLIIFAITFMINFILQQSPPPFRTRKPFVERREMETKLTIEGIENIYKYDLFGTFQQEEFRPSTKQLITPIPKPKSVSVKPPPELKKPTFIAPLNIQLKGIAYSYDEEKSISMITDEDNLPKKEDIYHVGDTLKDAQIIKIAKNRITLLRPNGQHETIFLRKEDNQDEIIQADTISKTWNNVIKKIKENNFEIDIKKITKTIPNLGTLAERLALLTTYKKGKPTGLKITDIDSFGTTLGLKKNDLVTDINKIPTADKKNRMKIYDTITNLKKGNTIALSLKRNQKIINLNYKLTDMIAIRKREFIPDEKKIEIKKKDALFKLSRLQEREKKRREFAKRHKTKQEDAVAEIRNRLLENLRPYSRGNRVR
jgi:type II secretory pathway component PulC